MSEKQRSRKLAWFLHGDQGRTADYLTPTPGNSQGGGGLGNRAAVLWQTLADDLARPECHPSAPFGRRGHCICIPVDNSVQLLLAQAGASGQSSTQHPIGSPDGRIGYRETTSRRPASACPARRKECTTRRRPDGRFIARSCANVCTPCGRRWRDGFRSMGRSATRCVKDIEAEPRIAAAGVDVRGNVGWRSGVPLRLAGVAQACVGPTGCSVGIVRDQGRMLRPFAFENVKDKRPRIFAAFRLRSISDRRAIRRRRAR